VHEIGHAVRTPSNVVQALLESILEQDGIDVDARRHIAQALGSAQELHDDLEELIEVASWTDDVAAGSTGLDGLVTEVVAELHAEITDRQVELSASIEDGVETRAPADRIRWITRRLLKLANDLSEPGGKIELVVGQGPDERPMLSVVTTAPHAAAALDQELRTVERVLVGCRGTLTHQHVDGRIRLVAVLPVGRDGAPTATRKVTDALAPTKVADEPLSEAVVPGPEPLDEVLGPLGAREILVVEDDDNLRSVLCDALAADYRVYATASAGAALSMVRQITPDVVICDLVLPRIGGEALIRSFRAEPGCASTAIIVVSGRTDDTIRTRVLQDGADDYLTKPFHLDELRTRIDKLLTSVDTIAGLRDDLTSADRLSHQLQHALDSRVLIEQAKGFLAARHTVDPNTAFTAMRAYARHHRRPIREVAALVLDGDVDIQIDRQ
jgi:DNA-binding response OmpR family regulator